MSLETTERGRLIQARVVPGRRCVVQCPTAVKDMDVCAELWIDHIPSVCASCGLTLFQGSHRAHPCTVSVVEIVWYRVKVDWTETRLRIRPIVLQSRALTLDDEPLLELTIYNH